jgi:hypothetical protein
VRYGAAGVLVGALASLEARTAADPPSNRTIVQQPPSTPSTTLTPLRVLKIRLDQGDRTHPEPRSTVSFEVLNDGPTELTDVVLRIFIEEVTTLSQPDSHPEPLAKYTIRGSDVVIQPGYSLKYELRLRNLPSECDCRAVVEVESVRALTTTAATIGNR